MVPAECLKGKLNSPSKANYVIPQLILNSIFDVEYYCRAILCARSNYFSAMLHGNWVEGKTNEIPLIG